MKKDEVDDPSQATNRADVDTEIANLEKQIQEIRATISQRSADGRRIDDLETARDQLMERLATLIRSGNSIRL
jgi:hypothetical protein